MSTKAQNSAPLYHIAFRLNVARNHLQIDSSFYPNGKYNHILQVYFFTKPFQLPQIIEKVRTVSVESPKEGHLESYFLSPQPYSPDFIGAGFLHLWKVTGRCLEMPIRNRKRNRKK